MGAVVLMAVKDAARIVGTGDPRSEREVTGLAEPAPLSGRKPGSKPRWLFVVLFAAALALASLGWMFRAPLVARLEPLAAPVLVRLGLAAPEAVPSPEEAPAESASDPNAVTLDEAGQRRIGLAFGEATIRKIVLPVRAPGTIAFDERRVTRLKPRTQGRVVGLNVQPGDTVRAGQSLATLDAAGVLDARNGLDEARANLVEAQATEKVADTNVKRGQDLLKIGGVAQAEVDRRQVDLAKAHAATLSAQAKVDLFQAQYDRLAPRPALGPGVSAIVAPIDGVVTSANLTLGEVVDTGRDAFTVADPSQVLVLANLYGADIARVAPGDAVAVRAPVPGHPLFEGRVRSVNAAVDPVTNTAPARIEIANPNGTLRANLFVSVEIAADLHREAVTIPAASVQQTEDGSIAFVRTGAERFEKRTLTLGVQRADWVEVTTGIRDGESVATQGSFGLKAILMRALLGTTD